MEAEVAFGGVVWVVEEAVGRGLAVVVGVVDVRSSFQCIVATADWQYSRLSGKNNTFVCTDFKAVFVESELQCLTDSNILLQHTELHSLGRGLHPFLRIVDAF